MGIEKKEATTLYVGADDSNNHDKNRAKIVCATFSSLSEDSASLYCSKKTSVEDFENWSIGDESREYRFGLLTDPEFMRMQPILPLCLPRLILDYAPKAKNSPEKLWIEVDGPLPRAQEEYIRHYLDRYFRKGVFIRSFVKRDLEMARRPKEQRYEQPRLINMAHVKAKHVYNNLTNYVESNRLVELNAEKLKDLYSKIARNKHGL